MNAPPCPSCLGPMFAAAPVNPSPFRGRRVIGAFGRRPRAIARVAPGRAPGTHEGDCCDDCARKKAAGEAPACPAPAPPAVGPGEWDWVRRWNPAGALPPGVTGVTSDQWAAMTEEQRRNYLLQQLQNRTDTTQTERIQLVGRLIAEGLTNVTTFVNSFLDRETDRLRTEAERDRARDELRAQIELAKIQAERDIRIAEAGGGSNNPPPPASDDGTKGTSDDHTPAPTAAPSSISTTTVLFGLAAAAAVVVAVTLNK